jgi:CDP-diacylglycerol--serine O-phosphatidyltransferase
MEFSWLNALDSFSLASLFPSLGDALTLQVPIVVGGIVHMLAVTRGWLNRVARPVCTPLFGANKTWRGFVLVPLFTAIGAPLSIPLAQLMPATELPTELYSWLWIAVIGGLGYVLAELPNSFCKRRLGVAPGESSTRYKTLFMLGDQLDSGIGSGIAFWLVTDCSLTTLAIYIATFPITALVVKRALFMTGLKKAPV